MFNRIFGKNNANKPLNESKDFSEIIDSRTPDRGFVWQGAHPSSPYGLYVFKVSQVFARRYVDATHQIKITLTIASIPGERLLYEVQDNFAIPGLEPSYVADLTAARLVKFLRESPNPRRVPGMFDLLYKGEEYRCSWHTIYDNYRRELLRFQLRKLNITYDQYISDRDAYNALRKIPETGSPT